MKQQAANKELFRKQKEESGPSFLFDWFWKTLGASSPEKLKKIQGRGWDKPSLSIAFWIVEQDAVAEWVYYADFTSISYSPTQPWVEVGRRNRIFNELPISVPLSFLWILLG